MANFTDPFQAVLDNVYPKFQYTAYHSKEATYLMWLNNHCKIPFTSAGEHFRLPIEYGGHVDTYTDLATAPEGALSTTIPTTEQDALLFHCSGFGVPILGANFNEKVIVGNDKNRAYDHYLVTTEIAAKRAQKHLSAQLHSNNASAAKLTCGLQWMVDQTDTVWGGLTTTSADLDGQYPQEDTTTTSITWKAMENLYMSCRAETDLILTTKAIFGYIWALRQSQEKYDPIPAGKEFAAVGAPYIAFNQIPIVWDENCVAASCYFLASKYIQFFQHSDWNLKAEKVCDRTPTQEVSIGRILWAGQHTCNARHYLGRFDGITS